MVVAGVSDYPYSAAIDHLCVATGNMIGKVQGEWKISFGAAAGASLPLALFFHASPFDALLWGTAVLIFTVLVTLAEVISEWIKRCGPRT